MMKTIDEHIDDVMFELLSAVEYTKEGDTKLMRKVIGDALKAVKNNAVLPVVSNSFCAMEKLIEKYKSKITQLQSKRNSFELKGISGACIAITGEIQAYNAVLADLKRVYGNPANSENANCAIFDVSQRSELLKAFYAYIDDKWALGMLTDKVDEVIEGFEKSL